MQVTSLTFEDKLFLSKGWFWKKKTLGGSRCNVCKAMVLRFDCTLDVQDQMHYRGELTHLLQGPMNNFI